MHSQHILIQTISVGRWNRFAYRVGLINAGTEEYGRQRYFEGELLIYLALPGEVNRHQVLSYNFAALSQQRAWSTLPPENDQGQMDTTSPCACARAFSHVLLQKATPDLLLAVCTHALCLYLGVINITRQPTVLQNARIVLTCCFQKGEH